MVINYSKRLLFVKLFIIMFSRSTIWGHGTTKLEPEASVQPYESPNLNNVTFVFYSLLYLSHEESIILKANRCAGHARSYPGGFVDLSMWTALARSTFFCAIPRLDSVPLGYH